MDNQSNTDFPIKKLPIRKKILIVDDDDSIRSLFFKKLEILGFSIVGARSVAEAERLIRTEFFAAIILDQYLEDGLGTDFLKKVLKQSPFSKIVFLTSHESVDLASETLLNGACGFLLKKTPIDSNIQKFVHILDQEFVRGDFTLYQPEDLIGKSDAVRKILSKIEKIKMSDSTVFLTGESGVGKELIAKTIHKLSARRNGPFIAINCAAISESLLEAELFGSKKGAYTDSRMDRKGYFESCSQGTLLLDEIGEMTTRMQAKLLRVLQEREVTPVGSCRPIKINTRIIAATNRNLKDDIALGSFREDLFYRLAVINIDIPPLRTRIEDLPLLVENFVQKFNKQFGKSVSFPSNEVYAKLKAYRWPGNIRELYNALERSVLLSEDGQMYLEDLLPPQALRKTYNLGLSSSFELDYRKAKANFEKAYIENLLKYTNYCVTDAARVSNQYRTNIYRLISKHGIDLKPK